MSNKLRVAILVSGGGSTMQAVGLACESGRLRCAELALVIASKPGAGGIAKAKKLIDPENTRRNVLVIRPTDFEKKDAFGEVIVQECIKHDIDLVFQCGWLPMTPANVAQHFAGRILNQHPGPLDNGRPDFGDLYGQQVHHAVLAFYRHPEIKRPGPPKTEATVHMVTADERYDVGGMIGTHAMQIRDDDTVETLKNRLLPVEHDLVIRTIERYSIENPIHPYTRTEPLIHPEEESILEWAKTEARRLYPHG